MKRISLHKVMAKLAEEETPEMLELSVLKTASQDAQRIFLDARTRASNMALDAADYMEKKVSDIYSIKSAVEADLKKLQKMQQEFGFETDLESKFKEALRDIDGYFSSADKWVVGLRASAKGKF